MSTNDKIQKGSHDPLMIHTCILGPASTHRQTISHPVLRLCCCADRATRRGNVDTMIAFDPIKAKKVVVFWSPNGSLFPPAYTINLHVEHAEQHFLFDGYRSRVNRNGRNPTVESPMIPRQITFNRVVDVESTFTPFPIEDTNKHWIYLKST